MTPQQFQELSSERPRVAKLVQPKARRYLILASCGGREWFQWGELKLPRRLNWLWRALARRMK